MPPEIAELRSIMSRKRGRVRTANSMGGAFGVAIIATLSEPALLAISFTHTSIGSIPTTLRTAAWPCLTQVVSA